jgi:hypothetical protein
MSIPNVIIVPSILVRQGEANRRIFSIFILGKKKKATSKI